MNSELTPENALQKVNNAYMLLDDIFHKLDNKKLDCAHLSSANENLTQINKLLYQISTIFEL